jgi:hypothetical protein
MEQSNDEDSQKFPQEFTKHQISTPEPKRADTKNNTPRLSKKTLTVLTELPEECEIVTQLPKGFVKPAEDSGRIEVKGHTNEQTLKL